MGFGEHDDGGGLSVNQLVQLIEITVIVYNDKVLLMLELKYVLQDELTRSCRDKMGNCISSKTKGIFCSPIAVVDFAQHAWSERVGTMAQVELRRITFAMLSSSRKCQDAWS